MIAWAERARTRLSELDTSDELLEELDRERQRLAGEVAELAARLSASRREAAGRASPTQVTVELAGLAMPHARIEVVVAAPTGRAQRADAARSTAIEVRGRRRTAPTRSSCGCWPTPARRPCRCRRAPPAVSCPG